MENYIVSARKYRPATFRSVVGQNALTTTLKNAIATGKLAHAYLFCGPRGVGKTTCARIFAKTINCLNPTPEGEACNECESCRAFMEQRSYNIHELDAASNNSVDDIRQLVEQVRIPPQIGHYKVYIIDEVHMLSASAFNAFLKTLEEPPRHAIFILATTEKHKILPTILSRCQIYDFNRISVEDMVAHLAYVASKEDITAEPEALNVIALKADGGMRDALSIFDQVVSFTGGHITYQKVIENLNVLDYEYYFRLTDCFLENRVTDALLLFNEVLGKGFEGGHFITGLASHLRDLLVSKDPATLPLLEVGAGIRQRYQTQARRCPLQFLYRAMKLCNECDLNYRASKNKRLLVELTLIEAAQITAPLPDTAPSMPGPTQPASKGPAPKTSPGTKPATMSKVSQAAPATAAISKPAATTTPQPHEAPAILKAAQDSATQRPPTLKRAGLGISIKGVVNGEANPQEQEQPRQPAQAGEMSQNLNGTLQRPQADQGSPMRGGLEEWSNKTPEGDVSFDTSPISEEALNRCWREYAASMPQEQVAMAKRMGSMQVHLTDADTFEAVVENEIVADSLTALIPQVQAYLRRELKNSRLTMKVSVSEQAIQPHTYNRAEKYRLMTGKNKALEQLKEQFGLEFY
ncbi:MAG: DNA polymerase III subunit gamma/tau [Prevotellaceae bacterium]|nr:DNA polymerase III subunit gamma/tau [Prevotellaceae bacterium]